MTIVDRYLFSLFLRTFLICFLSFAGLFVVVHLFSNLEEISALAKIDGWPILFYEFYGPRVAGIFDKTAAMLILAAAIFSVSLMQRRREMTAIEASGITKLRILRPVFLTALVIIGLTVANREYLLPKVKESLVRTAQNWGDKGNVDMTVQEDLTNGVVLRGDQLVLEESKVTSANVQLPIGLSDETPAVSSQWAVVTPASDFHPSGLWLHQVSNPKDIEKLPSIASEDAGMILFTPNDYDWLQPNQCFVACNFEVEKMAYGTKLVNYLSTKELIVEARKPRRWFGSDHQISIHSRIIRPLLDLTLLLLGLPLVLGSIERNVFVSFGICFWIVALFQVAIMACQFLGASSVIRPAALAAWLPAIVFVPVALVAMRRLKM